MATIRADLGAKDGRIAQLMSELERLGPLAAEAEQLRSQVSCAPMPRPCTARNPDPLHPWRRLICLTNSI